MPDDLDFDSAAQQVATTGGVPPTAPTPSPDPFDMAAEQVAGPYKVALATSMRSGQQANADQRAVAMALAKQSRLPVEVVERNIPAVRAKLRQSDADMADLRRNHPALADWLIKPDNAAISNDDLPAMRAIDVATRALRGDDPSGILPHGFLYDDGRIIEPLGDGSLANVYDSFADLHKELTRRGDLDAIKEMDRQQEASALAERFGPFANVMAGAAANLKSMQRALGTSNAYDHSGDSIAEASQVLAPGFWGDVQRGTGGLIADLPLMMSGGALTEGMVALSRIGRARSGVDALLQATAKGRGAEGMAALARERAAAVKELAAAEGSALLKGKAADFAKVATASQPLAIREGINDGQDNGVANGAMSWLIETVVPGAFGRTGVERYLVKGANEAVADGWKGFAKRLLVDAGFEGSDELVTEWAHAVHEAATGIDPTALEPDKLWRRLSVAGTVGAAAGVGFSLPANIAEKFSQDGEEARRATVHAGRLHRLTEALANSNTNKRAEQPVGDFIDKALGQSDRFQYVNAQDFRDAFQDPAKAAAELGVTKEYAEALATGGQLKVPTTTLVQRAAADEATAKLLDKVRRAPNARNAAEAAEFQDKAPDEVRRLANEAKASANAAKAAPADPVADLRSDIESKLIKAGQHPTTAKTNATVTASIFDALAKRSGKDAGELYRTYLDGRIKKVLPGLLKGEKFDIVDSMLERIRSGDVPTDKQVNGPSLVDFLRPKGLRDVSMRGELEHLKESDRTRQPGEKSLVRDDGITLDEARQLAEDKGYLEKGATLNDFMQAIDDEVRGNVPSYLEGGGDPNQKAIRDALDQLEETLREAGVDPLTATNKQARAALAKVMEEQEGKALGQPSGVSPRDDRLDLEALLKQWRKATGDRTPVGGDRAWELLREQSDQVDAENGKTYGQPGKKGQRRGELGFGKGRAFTIRLFESENLSTFLHEGAGHLSLEILGDLATAENAPADLVADYQAIRDWFGKNADDIRDQAAALAKDNGASDAVVADIRGASNEDVAKIAQEFRTQPKDGTAAGYMHEAMHEYFARGFEAYLMEGKAPVPSLRSAFARIKGWLVAIYRIVSTLRVNLSPEMRDVFDRLVAAEDEIDAAEERAGTTDILPAEAFPDAKTFDDYRTAVQSSQERAEASLRRQLVGEYRRELSRAWKEQRAVIEAEVTAQVDERPVYQVIAALQRGQTPTGETLPDDFQGMKLDRDELVREWGEAVLDKLPGPGDRANRGAYVYASEGGMPLADVAALWGYKDPSAMIEAMIAAPDRQSVIDTMTNERMRKEHPDPLLDGSLPDRADAAIAGDQRGELLGRELRALGMKTGQTPAPVQVLRQFAEDTIAEQKARDLRPDVYQRAASQAARRKTEAAAKGDWSTAYVEAQREALNVELYRASTAAKQAGEAGRAYLRKLDTLDSRQRIGKAGGWEFSVFDDEGTILASFPKVEEARAFAAAEPGRSYRQTNGYLEQIEAILDGFSLRRPSNRSLRKRENFRKWLAKQQADGEPVDIDPQVIDDLGERNWNDLTVAEQTAVVDAVRNIAHLAGLKNKLLKASRARDLAEAQEAGATSIIANKKGTVSNQIGDTPTEDLENAGKGFLGWHRKDSFLLRKMDGYQDAGTMWDLIQRPRNDAATDEETRNLVNAAKVDAAFKKWGKGLGWTRQDIPGTKLRLTLEHKIAMALNWGHAEGRRRILRHLEWEGFNAKDVQAVLDSLDAKDYQLVDDLLEIINSHWSDVADLERRMTGIPPEKVKALPFSSTDPKTGKVTWHDGGYYPLKYDAEKSHRGGDAAVKAALEDNLKAAGARGQTRRSHTKQRVDDVKGLAVDLSLDVAGKHLAEVVHDLTHREMVRDQMQLLKDAQPIADAIIAKHGVGKLKQLVETAGAIATRDIQPDSRVSSFVRLLRRGNTAATFTYQLTSALMNLTGVLNSVARVGPLRLLSAIGSVIKDSATLEWAGKWVQDKSAMMKVRSGNNIREVSEALREVGRLSGLQKAIRFGYLPMQKVVQLVDTITWIAAYRQSMETQLAKGATAEDADKTSIAVADQTVIDTQGSGRIGDLSAMQRGGELAKLFTMFYGYFNVQANLIGEQYGMARERGGAQWLRSALVALMVLPMSTFLTNLIKAALRGDDRKEKPEEMAKRLALEQLGTAAGMLVGVREVSGAIESGFGYSGPASLSAVGNATKLINEVRQGDVDAGMVKALLSTAGSLTGAPSRVANQAIDAVLQFEKDGKGGAALRTLVFGKPLKEH